MEKRNFMQMLLAQWAQGKFVSVGLDPEYEKIPEVMRSSHPSVSGSLWQFNRAIVEMTMDLTNVYKINTAFYERHGIEGIKALTETIAFINNEVPTVPVILDVKRGDIGNTNLGHIKFAFGECNADAVTVNPYLGKEALKPFLDLKDKGVIVLCKTSNPGAGEFQNVLVDVYKSGEYREFDRIFGHEMTDFLIPLYQYVAFRVATKWNENGNCALVVGATAPEEEIKNIRNVACEMPILIPGIGAQGGDLEKSVRAACCCHGKCRAIVNSSRGIIHASSGPDFAERAREETEKLNNQIREILNWKNEEVKS
ncbi:MAG: orotidine-5'-phosphate decarboxylase [Candidatus Jorgensenbacteria bacterium]|nr:orotidine-5'-phosphate decarboxylase [Candidatus Jorgensenbacteria bacterium]